MFAVKYEYPPSRHIQSYAPFDEASHCFGAGQVHFSAMSYDCEFEVVYTHNCEIVVLLYLEQQAILELFWNKHESGESGSETYTLGEMTPNSKFDRLVGKDKRSGFEILVEGGFLRSLGGSSRPPAFVANTFQWSDTRSHVCENYPYKNHYVFELTGIDFNTEALHQREFPISPSHPPLHLEVIYKRTRQYDNQPLVRLLVPFESVPTGWTPEETIDLWCALISLAIGRDIRWVEMDIPSKDQILVKWIHRGNVQGGGSFVGLISVYPLDFDSHAPMQFLYECFQSIENEMVSPSLASHYILAIRQYVTYNLMQHRTEDHARLAGTTVEELLTAWEKATNIPATTSITEDEAKQILESAKSHLYPTVATFTVDGKKKQRIKKKISHLLRKELPRLGFLDRLARYFDSHNNQMPTNWFDEHVRSRLERFVDTRDTVVHTGKFPTENPKISFWYYYNLLMILPLMVMTVFGYSGAYIDLTKYWKQGIQEPATEVDDVSNELD